MNQLETLKSVIEKTYAHPWESGTSPQDPVAKAIEEAIALLDQGKIRVVQFENQKWQTQDWVKRAILLYFKMRAVTPIESGGFTYLDKIPVKRWTGKEGVRVVPPAIARYGSFVEPGAVLMPSYVNIGAYVGKGSMIDTWATVGSCAQIGANVHLSGGVGIGGVLEPVQATPVIIEDNAFIGSRSIIVEGAIIGEGAVIGAGVTITASTKIIDVTQSQPVEYKGHVPARSVVIPGMTAKQFAAGTYQVPCALIIGERKKSTDEKTSLNDVLRDFQLSV